MQPCARCDGPAAEFRCFALASPGCEARRGRGAPDVRWAHVSCLEHACSECVAASARARGKPTGKGGASAAAAAEAAALRSLVEHHLPNWAQCARCATWRMVAPSAEPWADGWPLAWECRDSSKRGASCLAPTDPLLRALAAKDDAEREGDELPYFVHPSVAPLADVEAAAIAARLAPAAPSSAELAEYASAAIDVHAHALRCVGLRNLALALWQRTPTERLAPATVVSRIAARGLVRVRCAALAPRILHCLERMSLLNCGAIPCAPPPARRARAADADAGARGVESAALRRGDGRHAAAGGGGGAAAGGAPPPRVGKRATIAIIGAGLAGLAAARRLTSAGHKVVVLEGRQRIGGRVHTARSEGCGPAELGASLIVATVGNPLLTVAEQIGLGTVAVNHDRCPLLCPTRQQPLHAHADKQAEALWNRLLAEAHASRTAGLNRDAKRMRAMAAALTESSSAGEGAGAGALNAPVAPPPCPEQQQAQPVAAAAAADAGAAVPAAVPAVSAAQPATPARAGIAAKAAAAAPLCRARGRGAARPAPVASRVWVGCDRCGRWRGLPGSTDRSSLPARWFCELSADPLYNSCGLPQELPDDVIDEAILADQRAAEAAEAEAEAEAAEAAAAAEEAAAAAEAEAAAAERAARPGASGAGGGRARSQAAGAPAPSASPASAKRKQRAASAPALPQPARSSRSLGAALASSLAKSAGIGRDVRRALHWHMANMEYGCAARLEDVSLSHWDQDDSFDLGGQHLLVTSGYDQLPAALAAGLNVRLGCEVSRVRHGPAGVVLILKGGGEVKADAALVTVPLGVLKARSLRFEPELPAWKRAAIDRLGFGSIEKVILRWGASQPAAAAAGACAAAAAAAAAGVRAGAGEGGGAGEGSDEAAAEAQQRAAALSRVFWDPTVDFFGALPSATTDKAAAEERGEAFLFWSLLRSHGEPALMAIYSGQAAERLRGAGKAEAVARTLAVLRRLFGADRVPEPTSTLTSSWAADRFARGAYSYVACGSSGDDYDLLASPVGSRLFFAGEGTSREMPATTNGAFSSGVREAQRIVRAAASAFGAPPPPKGAPAAGAKRSGSGTPKAARRRRAAAGEGQGGAADERGATAEHGAGGADGSVNERERRASRRAADDVPPPPRATAEPAGAATEESARGAGAAAIVIADPTAAAGEALAEVAALVGLAGMAAHEQGGTLARSSEPGALEQAVGGLAITPTPAAWQSASPPPAAGGAQRVVHAHRGVDDSGEGCP